MKATYTKLDCGCYVDSARGVYAVDAIIAFARAHGATIEHDADCPETHTETYFPSEFGGCPYSGDYEDEADDYMNSQHPVENCYWGRNDNGDWGLWNEDGDL